MQTNEIKEILEALRDSIDDTGTNKVNFINWVDKIEDYITNLQEENRINNDLIPCFKNREKELKKQINVLQEENERLKERMGRITEYIKPLVTERENQKYYSITWYCKDVLLSWLGEDTKESEVN